MTTPSPGPQPTLISKVFPAILAIVFLVITIVELTAPAPVWTRVAAFALITVQCLLASWIFTTGRTNRSFFTVTVFAVPAVVIVLFLI
ncbi:MULTISPECIES: hypothetical protein [unclassified Leucobacter]|uniref:hypothetical protein n=1 Tax=unclassified Leucobacter TaxID=2621730 RepID=UPI00301A9978